MQITSGFQPNEITKLLYNDANNLYGRAISQYLPAGDFKKIKYLEKDDDSVLIDEIKEDIIKTPDDTDDNEHGYLKECDLEYPAENKEKTKNFPLCPHQTKADSNLFSVYWQKSP